MPKTTKPWQGQPFVIEKAALHYQGVVRPEGSLVFVIVSNIYGMNMPASWWLPPVSAMKASVLDQGEEDYYA